MREFSKASPDELNRILDRRPLLWVGAGLSVAAGLPSTDRLVRAMTTTADSPIDPALSFEEVADAFVDSMGESALSNLLQELLATPAHPTAAHRAIARAAGDGRFAAIVTTNYDDLLERSLADADVRVLEQVGDANLDVDDPDAVRLLKLHGSRDDWKRVVLSGRSYAEFGSAYPFLNSDLHALLWRHPVLFVGCSMLDRRIVEWLASLDEDAAKNLRPWRALMKPTAWEEAITQRPELARANLAPVLLDDHDHLQRVWVSAVPEPPPTGEMVLDFEVRDGRLAARCGDVAWEPESPIDDAAWVEQVEALQTIGTRPLLADDHGTLAPTAGDAAARLRKLATAIGQRLTAVLAPAARERLEAVDAVAREGVPSLLRVRVACGAPADEPLADRLLALPWELLRVGDRFPVEEHTLDLAREAVVPGLDGLREASAELSVVATVAAPIDQGQLDHEGEMYRLWRALGARDEGRLRVTDLGTLDDLADLVTKGDHPPTAVHFTGHGEPGTLVFEDAAARSRPVAVGDLVQALRVGDSPLPSLIYLSACHGTTVGKKASEPAAGEGTKETERMVEPAAVATAPSTAAALHRAGFAQVVSYFGPVGDTQATRTAAEFYGALARGATARAALRRAREIATRPLPLGDGWGVYPLGWAQLALYHRGADRPTALATSGDAGPLDVPRRREVDLLNRAGDLAVGVQQLRHGFIGRRAPRSEAIGRWREGRRLLVIVGLGGLGKTTLCTELLRVLAPGKVLALDGRFAGSQPDPLAALWQELEQARPKDPQWAARLGQIQQEHESSADAFVAALGVLVEVEGGLTVYLDDAESLQVPLEEAESLGRWRDGALQSWWRGLVALAEDGGDFGVIVSSRYRPEGTPERAMLWLEAMSEWETLRLMSWMTTLREAPHEDRAWLAEERLDGHPRTVEWLEVLAEKRVESLAPPGGRFAGAWRAQVLEPILDQAGAKIDADLLLGEVWRVLDDDAREHLGRASVLRAPAPWDLIVALAPSDPSSGRRLGDAGLLIPFQSLEKQPWWAPHRLVSETVGELWDGDRLAAHRLVGGWFETRYESESTVANAQRAVDHLCAAGDGDRAFATALPLVLHLREFGRYREALGWVERVLDAGASGHQRGLSILLQVQLMRSAGRLPVDAAEQLLEALDHVRPENRGHVLHELGAFWRAKGRLEFAADYLRRAVDAKIAESGELSTDVATSLHSLAGVLQAQGDLSGARSRLERSLEITASVFGTEEHPDVAASLHELAGVLQAQGDLSGARSRLERSLEIEAAVRGTEEHPAVAASLHSLAGVLQAQGDLSGARSRLERSLEIKESVFGTEEHPAVAASLHSLAGVLQAQGDLSGARSRLERSLAIRDAVYGTRDHYSSAISEVNLGMLLIGQGEAEEGVKLLVHAYQVFMDQLGPQHAFTQQLASLFEQMRPSEDED